ncbi:type IIL restriction-modification enzyme MmeI, partial [Escherichia coli]
VEPEDYPTFAADPVASKYLRPFLGARELIHGEDRWCLWLVDLDPADLARSPLLKSRVEGVRAMRAASKAASTRESASTPHLFRQIAPVTTSYI